MKFLNLGCGQRFDPRWTNIDFVSTGPGVIAHNLLTGIPFLDNEFDLVYHSHVFEHIPKSQADFFIRECVRVLKPGGVLRLVVPDLEKIASTYLKLLEKGIADPDSLEVAADYDWTMIEMYDQTVRHSEGGEMIKYLSQDKLINEDFIYMKIGKAAKVLRAELRSPGNKKTYQYKPPPLWKRLMNPKTYFWKLKNILFSEELSYFNKNKQALEIGKYRLGGEVHQWMYDRYSIARIFKKHGLGNVIQRTSTESFIHNWSAFNLDTDPDGSTYKPDSLFMEAFKK